MPVEEQQLNQLTENKKIRPYADLQACIKSINRIIKSLEEYDFIISNSSPLTHLIQQAKDLEELSKESLESIKDELNIEDYVLIFEQILQAYSLLNNIHQILNDNDELLSKEEIEILQNYFPIHYNELTIIHLKNLNDISCEYLEKFIDMFIIALYRVYSEHNIDLSLPLYKLPKEYKKITKILDEFCKKDILILDQLEPTLQQYKLNREIALNKYFPPPSSIASKIIHLDQGLIPQVCLVGGFCMGDAILTLTSKQPLSLGHTPKTVFEQLKTVADKNFFSSKVYSIKLRYAKLEYPKWTKILFDIIFTIFSANFEHNDKILLGMKGYLKENGAKYAHAVTFFRLKNNLKYNYYFRDANYGVFKIKDTNKFIIWLSDYLLQHGVESINISFLLQEWPLKHIVDKISSDYSSPYFLIARMGQNKWLLADEILKIDISKLHDDFNKKLYCVFALHFDHLENYKIISRAVSVLNSFNAIDVNHLELSLAITIQQGYTACARNNATLAIKHFYHYNTMLSDFQQRDMFKDLPLINILDNNVSFDNIWSIKKRFQNLFQEFNSLCRAKLFKEAYRIAKGASLTAAEIKQNTLLFRKFNEHQVSKLYTDRNTSSKARVAFDERFGLKPRVTM